MEEVKESKEEDEDIDRNFDEVSEEEEMLEEIGKRTKELINNIIDSHGYDKAYFQFVLDVYTYDVEFRNQTIKNIFDEREDYHVCTFCGEETNYYSPETGMYLCAECYSKIKKHL